MRLALRGSREVEGGGAEPFGEDDIRAALREKALRMYTTVVAIAATLTIIFVVT